MPVTIALFVYGALVGALSCGQAGFYNADFIAYVTIGRTLLTDPVASVTGYWSPLFSWAMAPLLALSVDDLVAGRIILVAAGAGYIVAVHALAVRLGAGRLARSAALTCAVLQANQWATHLLVPDLLASALLFAYLAQLTDERLTTRRWRALAAGATAGSAYLAKAYMLPFLVALTPIALGIAARSRGSSAWRPLPGIAIGTILVAGPWVAILSEHYGGFTFSTAASANRANFGPLHYGQDRLWHPPLEAGFILDPHFGSDWSPFASPAFFGHQLFLLGKNALRSLEHLAGWLSMVGAALVVRRRTAPPARLPGATLALVFTAASIYVAGYCLIDVERRYLVPTAAPLLCLGAATIFADSGVFGGSRAALYGVLLAALFGLQEQRLLLITALRHPQSHARGPTEQVAADLAKAGFAGPFAASDWHAGLSLAYVAGTLPQYLGCPLASTPDGRHAELEAAGAQFYLQFGGADGPVPADWRCATRRLASARGVGRAASPPVAVFVRPR